MNVLSLARFFLFGSRDVWFEIGLPIFLRVELGWKRELVGLILAGEQRNVENPSEYDQS